VITPLDPTLAVSDVLIRALKGDGGLTAFTSSDRIYPETVPADPVWPFVRIDGLVATPLLLDGAEGGGGGEVGGLIHCFARPNPPSILDARATAAAMVAHVVRIVAAMDAAELDDIAGARVDIHVRQARIAQDPGEAGAFHGIVTIAALAL
jgi:hypothetical protein